SSRRDARSHWSSPSTSRRWPHRWSRTSYRPARTHADGCRSRYTPRAWSSYRTQTAHTQSEARPALFVEPWREAYQVVVCEPLGVTTRICPRHAWASRIPCAISAAAYDRHDRYATSRAAERQRPPGPRQHRRGDAGLVPRLRDVGHRRARL